MKNEYTVIFTQTETFFVSVIAESEADARCKADSEFENGNYKEAGDCNVELTQVLWERQMTT